MPRLLNDKIFGVETLLAERIQRDTSVIGGTLTITESVTFDGTETHTGAVTMSGATTISGALTTSGGVTSTALQFPSTAGPTNGAVTAAMSGRLCIGVVDAAWTLPTVTGNAGVWYTFVTGVASAGTGVTITALTAVIQGKTTPAGTAAITNATTITNTPGTDVVGDYVTLRCDGTNWWMVGMSGIYA